MKIDVQKTERKTLFGGARYVVTTKLHLTPEEQALVRRHKVHGIFSEAELHKIHSWFGDTPYMNFLKRGGSNVGTLVAGGKVEVDSLAVADSFEALLMTALKNLKESLIANEQSAKELGQRKSYEL